MAVLVGLLVGRVRLWLVYGVLSGDVPVLAANAVTIVLVGLLLGLKGHTAIRGRRDSGSG